MELNKGQKPWFPVFGLLTQIISQFHFPCDFTQVYIIEQKTKVMFLPHVGIVSALVQSKKQILTNETISMSVYMKPNECILLLHEKLHFPGFLSACLPPKGFSNSSRPHHMPWLRGGGRADHSGGLSKMAWIKPVLNFFGQVTVHVIDKWAVRISWTEKWTTGVSTWATIPLRA